MFDPIKKIKIGQTKALAVFEKAKTQQDQVLVAIAQQKQKTKEAIEKEQAKLVELETMNAQAERFDAKIREFLCEEPTEKAEDNKQ